MSNAVFPTLPGLAWNLARAPVFTNRSPQSVAGRELSVQYQQYPMYRYSLNFEVLRDSITYPEYDTLLGFILARSIEWDSFLFTDQWDNTVVAMLFGNPDGNIQVFQLTRAFGAGGSTFAEPVQNLNGAEHVFRLTWQGNQLQYKTARTNYFQNSANINTAATWVQNIGGFWTETSSTAITGPDGTTNNLTKFVATAAPSVLFKRPSVGAEPSLTSGTYVSSLWIYVPTQGGVTSWQYINDVNDTYVGASFSSTLFDQWVRASSVVTTAATGTQWDQNIRFNNATPTVGLLFYATCAQVEAGSTPTSFIATAAAVGTVTDYSIDANAVVTFSSPPAVSDILTWSGSFYYRCRFDMNQIDTQAMMLGLWNVPRLDLLGAPGNRV